MQVVERQVKDKAGMVIATLEIEQADSWDEACDIAGSPQAALALFNRGWVVVQQNKNRPHRATGGSGAAVLVKGFKKLSPEVQMALKGKTPEEIAELLAMLPGV